MVQIWVNFRLLKNNHSINYIEPIQSLLVNFMYTTAEFFKADSTLENVGF